MKIDTVVGAKIDALLGTGSSLHAGTSWDFALEGNHRFQWGSFY